MGFLDARGTLQSGGSGFAAGQLDAIQRALGSDYRALTALTRNNPCRAAGAWLEAAMVHADFQLMRAWYASAGLLWPSQAHGAVSEMSEIVRYFANAVGERAQLSEA